MTPIDTRVSIVLAPCRALTAAARWNGQPHTHTTTLASASDTHCQVGNCHAGTIENAITGTPSAAARTTLSRSSPASSTSGASGRGSSAS